MCSVFQPVYVPSGDCLYLIVPMVVEAGCLSIFVKLLCQNLMLQDLDLSDEEFKSIEISNVCWFMNVFLLIVVSQVRSVDDSKDADESVDVDEVCIHQLYVCISVFGCQGLLDDGDSSMEDGEVKSKVSVCVKYVL